MKKMIWFTSLFLLMATPAVRATVRLPDILSDSMVLQRGTMVPVFGRASPGERITVLFAGQTRSAITGKDSTWKIQLSPLHADATPRTMTIRGDDTIRLKGILIGEVWLCSGQSNMQLILSRTQKGDSVIASAHHPLLRLFNVSRKVAFKHSDAPLGIWQDCTPASVREFSAAAYYFGLALQRRLKVPVGIINASFGGSQVEAWTPVSYLHTPELQPCIDRAKIWAAERPAVHQKYAATLARWRIYAAKERGAGRTPKEAPHPPDALREYRIAGSIYRGMITPLMPFKIKGAIWYQGASNEGRAEQYGVLLPTMIRAWRQKWGQGNFPFGIIQLPNYRDHQPQPEDGAWSHIRDAQRWASDTVVHTGLIVTIDIGEAHNIHSHDKLDVGKRMCRWALADVYHKDLLPGGPLFRHSEAKGNRMIITFSVIGKGLRTRDGKAPQEFALAGPDHRWHWAQAKIKGKDQVVVWSDQVKRPVAVRYGFNNNPRDPNLTNDSGVPASPFRSDNWPGPTHGKK